MKIGIDCRLWSETGVGRYIRNLVEQLLVIDRKNEYILFVLPKDVEDIKNKISNLKKNWKLEIGNWKLRPADVKWHTFEEQIKLPQILSRENLDLMHFPYHSVPIFYNKPFVLTIHDLIPYNFPTGKASTLPFPIYNLKLLSYKFVINQAARKAKGIITVSNATKQEIVDHLKINPGIITVTYEGADREISNIKYQMSKINEKWQMKNDKYFLYVGNAYPHKNLERLFNAFRLFCHPEASAEGSKILRSAQSDIKLIFVGKEDYFYNRLKERVKNLDLDKKVIFFGEAMDEELASLYSNALAFITPSLMEGFGLPALEAMANKCLVLASDIPSLKEICGDAAIYFNPYNVEDISEKMKVICSNDSNHRSEKIKKGLERVKLFSWEKMTKETLKIYESCVGL